MPSTTTTAAATGVTLADGSRITAPIVASNVSAKLTFLKFLKPECTLPESLLLRDIRTFRTSSAAFKINIACERLPVYPEFRCRNVRVRRYPTYAHIGPTIEYLERAHDDAKWGEWSREPFITPVTPSFVELRHRLHLRASTWCICSAGHAPYTLAQGDSGEPQTGVREDGALGALDRSRTGLFRRDYRHAGISSVPPDIEAAIGAVRTGIFSTAN